MSTLLIALPAEVPSPGVMLDYVLSNDGLGVRQYARASWGVAPAWVPRSAEIVLLLPMAALSWHQVQLPQGSLPKAWGMQQGWTRLRAILDGLLEEQLLDEPTALHLALQPDAASAAKPWVMACDRGWLTAWLEALSEAGLQVKRIVPAHTPETLAQQVHVVGDADRPELIGLQSPADGAQMQPGVLACALSPVASTLLGELSERTVLAEPAVAEVAEAQLGRAVVLQPRAERLLQAAAGSWNVAQFELAARVRGPRWSLARAWLGILLQAPQWRAARWSALALVLINLVGLNAWALHTRQGLQQQGAQLRSLLTQTFRNIPVVVDAPAQMARQVQDLQRNRGALSPQAMEALLNHVAALAPPSFRITGLDYAGGELQLSAAAMSTAEQTRLVQALKARGVQAQWQGGRWTLRAETPS
jgi:general secretion pathway protein L